MTTFNELHISEAILRAVSEMGYEQATEIQAKAIPYIMEGKDVLGRSNTGTGKTAAFGIPAIEMVQPQDKYANALIICPTRELVTQVAMELRKFSKYKEGVKIVPIYGGQPIERQIQLLKRGCGIVVGTPGRIMDHLRRRTLKLFDIRMVILDEADEMLNMGFKEDIEEILSLMPSEHSYQTILFSATWPSEIMRIAKEFQNDPVTVEIKSAQRTIDTVEQLLSYKGTLETEKTDLLQKRKELYSKSRKTRGEEKEAIRSQLSDLSKRLSVIRKEVRLCESIEARNAALKEKLSTIRADEEQQRKELMTNEYKRRSGRTNRPNELGRI